MATVCVGGGARASASLADLANSSICCVPDIHPPARSTLICRGITSFQPQREGSCSSAPTTVQPGCGEGRALQFQPHCHQSLEPALCPWRVPWWRRDRSEASRPVRQGEGLPALARRSRTFRLTRAIHSVPQGGRTRRALGDVTSPCPQLPGAPVALPPRPPLKPETTASFCHLKPASSRPSASPRRRTPRRRSR